MFSKQTRPPSALSQVSNREKNILEWNKRMSILGVEKFRVIMEFFWDINEIKKEIR